MIDATELDRRVAELALRDLPLARSLLAEVVRIPADHVDRPVEEGGDPLCGLSNHEGPRLTWLRRRIVETGAVADPRNVDFDAFGNLVWEVSDPSDGIAAADKKVILFDGHSDTVRALRAAWRDKTGGGIDAYGGLTDPARVDEAFLRRELGWLPPRAEWDHLLFGRGSADQLGGVVAEVVATRILRELAPLGALRGVIVRAVASVAEEDNDGGGPMFIKSTWAGAPLDRVPDLVVLTEGTGDARKGALGIYRGQRGRMQIEVVVTGRSCHGSMPWEGLNPLEYAARILVEAADAYDRRQGFLDHGFLGHGTRTASWAHLDTPSDCAVPDRFVFRFDRRLTVGETPEQAIADVLALSAVERARSAGLRVDVGVPRYVDPTWRGHPVDNPQIYPGWETPADHPAVAAAVRTYLGVVAPHVQDSLGGGLHSAPRVDRWIFSTDGVGFSVPKDDPAYALPASKGWVVSGPVKHPPMIGFGPGIEQNTHKIGECVDTRELRHAIAFLARLPSVFRGG